MHYKFSWGGGGYRGHSICLHQKVWETPPKNLNLGLLEFVQAFEGEDVN